MTLARIFSSNIYLNFFSKAHFYWRSLKSCNIAKRNCLSYVWMAKLSWSYCSFKIQILRLFRARSSKTMECRFTMKHQKQPLEVFCKKRRPATLLIKTLWNRFFPVNFAKFLRTPPNDCFWSVRDIIIMYSYY